MQRRKLVQALAALTAPSLVGCRRPVTRERVLESIAHDVVAPVMNEAAERTRELERAVTNLTPRPQALEAAQSAWKSAALAWKRAGTFRDGPFQDQNALLRATRYPARPHVIEGVLAESAPLDQARVQQLGSGEKGLYALEYLLFDVGGKSALERLRSAQAPRVITLARELANELVALAARIEEGLGRGGKQLAAALVEKPQANLSRLVNTLIEGLELMAEGQLGLVFHLSEAHRLQPSDIEGAYARISHELARARLTSVAELYRNGEHSLSALVRAKAPNADASINERFDKAIATLRTLTLPLDEAVDKQRSQLYESYLKIKSLEQGMKVHLPSALGVTITFSSVDAD